MCRVQPGRGPCFRIELAVDVAQESEVREEPEWPSVFVLEPGQPEYRVLIVEDDRESALLLERLLQHAGFAVQIAEDGAQAVAKFGEWRPQFIWMDLHLPVIDGLEATRRIRACEGGSEVKIAAATASGFVGERSEILAAGLDDYLHKPYRPEEIFACMARHLGVRYTRKQAAASANREMAVELGVRGSRCARRRCAQGASRGVDKTELGANISRDPTHLTRQRGPRFESSRATQADTHTRPFSER